MKGLVGVFPFYGCNSLWESLFAAEECHDRTNAKKFSSSICEHCASMFKKSANPRETLFLQNGDPSQNSVKSRTAWDKFAARKFTIPTRSPDLNSIGNIFHVIKRKLHHDALELAITQEDFVLFST